MLATPTRDQKSQEPSHEESSKGVGQMRTAPSFSLSASGSGDSGKGNALQMKVAQRAEKTPAEKMNDALQNFNDGKATMITLAKTCIPYAGSNGRDVLAIFDKVSYFEGDNLAYAMASNASDSEMRTWDKAVLERMVTELSNQWKTTSWEANSKMAGKVQGAIKGAAEDKAKKDAEEAAWVKLWSKPRLTTEEIAIARTRIAAMKDGPDKVQYYQKLQEKVEYINQRNNSSYVGEDASGGSCNLTSLAMCMSYLGLSIPEKYKTMKDFPKSNVVEQLEFIRRTEKCGARTDMGGWGGVATAVGAKKTDLVFDQVKDRKWWEANVRDAHINAGHSIMCSIHGHIIRIQGMNDTGVVVDDPYGQSKLKTGKTRGWGNKNDSSREDLKGKNKGVGENTGEDHVWPWADVEIHNFHWIVAFSRA